MSKRGKITLDQWITSEDTQQSTTVEAEKETDHKVVTIASLVEEFARKIKMPELRDSKKNIYKIYELLPENKRGLIVTEKAKVASAIARALGGGKKRIIKTKWGDVVVYDVVWNSRYLTIIPLRGHLTEYATIDEYRGDWKKTDPRDLINPDVLREIITEKHIAEALRRAAYTTDLLILATDADEEGANIGLEVYELLREIKNLPVVQMWFISLNPKELRQAFLNPIDPKWAWAYAVKARRIIDAMIGFSATRELTVYLHDYLKQLKTKVFSVGRVQTPTLYLIYLRENEILNFKPKHYWVLQAQFKVKDNVFTATHEKSPFKDSSIALRIYEKIKNAKTGLVREVIEEEKTLRPPTPLNTTKALMILNEILRLSSKRAMAILEDLYLNGLITYPRTETDKYPDNYNHLTNLRILADFNPVKKHVEKALQLGAKLQRNGTKLVGDHLPITPINVPKDISSLPTKAHLEVYEIIVRRYVALFLPPAIITRKRVTIDVLGEAFKTIFTHVKSLGFLEVYPFSGPKEKASIEILPNTLVSVLKITSPQRKSTKPPSRLSEGELISLMERLALGTKSTRPEHIETLIARGYVKRKGRRLFITDIGYSLISFLERIWPDFVKPFFSAYVHVLMRRVMNGEIDWNDMVNVVRDKYILLFDELRKNKAHLASNMKTAVEQNIAREKVMSCPKCQGAMVIKPTKSGKINILSCLNCGFSTLVPLASSYKLVGVKCAICGSEVLALRRKKRTVYLCPFCWREYGPCYKCPKLENCGMKKVIQKEEEKYIVGNCECGGVLKFLPSKRIVVCNKCGKRYYLPRDGSVTLLKKTCDKHNVRLFSIRRKGKKYHYCIICSSSRF